MNCEKGWSEMAEGVHQITANFEEALCKYTGAPYAVALDNMSNALFLALKYEGIEGKEITIPSRTYPSVPCEIIHAGGRVRFSVTADKGIKGAYLLGGTRTIDSALRFTAGPSRLSAPAPPSSRAGPRARRSSRPSRRSPPGPRGCRATGGCTRG